MDEVAQQQRRHIGQHQAGEDFVGVEPNPQESGNRAPCQTAEDARESHCGQDQPALHAVKRERHPAAADRAERELPLRADIPHVGTETERQSDTDYREWRRLDQ